MDKLDRGRPVGLEAPHQPPPPTFLINLTLSTLYPKNTTIKHRPSSINHQSPTSLINHQQSPPTFLINLTSSPHQHCTLFLIKTQPQIMNIPHQPPPSPTFLINLTSSRLSTNNLFSETSSTKHYPSAINHNCQHFASTNNHQLSTFLINHPEPPPATFLIHRKPYQSH